VRSAPHGSEATPSPSLGFALPVPLRAWEVSQAERRPNCPRCPSALPKVRDNRDVRGFWRPNLLPFCNLRFPRPPFQGSTPGRLGHSSVRPLQPHAGSPTSPSCSVPYFCSLLEHLGKARGFGDVKRHGQTAKSPSRARSEDVQEARGAHSLLGTLRAFASRPAAWRRTRLSTPPNPGRLA
jgi:hypothetical protein